MDASPLHQMIHAQKQGLARGITSICSANDFVLEASFAHGKRHGLPLLIESTCNQVNQFGGYTGQTPRQFVQGLQEMAAAAAFPSEQLIMGGDHLGPNPWRHLPAEEAMDRSRALVAAYVDVGYTKIHIDTSMKCADDTYEGALPVPVIAARAADLARVAEESYQHSGKRHLAPLYVIGTEVPTPGGIEEEEGPPAVTATASVKETIAATREAFFRQGLEAAWERVIAVVVQPGVEFGNEVLYAYDSAAAQPLATFIQASDRLVFEAHSTDYQSRTSLHELVRDHFAILKVGPALTFAFREAIFALAEIEAEWLGGRQGVTLSRIRETIDAAMLAEPHYWRGYYHGDAQEQRFARRYSMSDRIRYYWPVPAVQASLDRLLANLAQTAVPPPLLSQYLPGQYRAVRDGRIPNQPHALIADKIAAVLDDYAFACCQT